MPFYFEYSFQSPLFFFYVYSGKGRKSRLWWICLQRFCPAKLNNCKIETKLNYFGVFGSPTLFCYRVYQLLLKSSLKYNNGHCVLDNSKVELKKCINPQSSKLFNKHSTNYHARQYCQMLPSGYYLHFVSHTRNTSNRIKTKIRLRERPKKKKNPMKPKEAREGEKKQHSICSASKQLQWIKTSIQRDWENIMLWKQL